MDLATRIPELLAAHPLVRDVRLIGSRAAGTQTALSDWDFGVETSDLEGLSQALAGLVAPLQPLAQQWDPLGEHPTYMLMLHGPTKVDFIFVAETMRSREPWEVRPDTLAALDDHFWDWILWLSSKRAKGRSELVREELAKLHGFLLGPLGVGDVPATIEQAVDDYLQALPSAERRLGVSVPPALRDEVLPVVR